MNLSLINSSQYPVLDPLNSREHYDFDGLPLRLYHPPTRLEDEEKEKRILVLNGIDTNNAQQKAKKRYRLFICQSTCFGLFQLKSKKNGQPLLNITNDYLHINKWIRISINLASKEIKRIISLARRALYVLGYDLGMVEVSVYRDAPKYCVTKLANKPLLSKKYKLLLTAEYEKAVSQMKEELSQTYDPTLGADLEFVLRHSKGKFILASKYFSKEGRIGYDSISLRGHRNKHPIAELRPAPSKDPEELLSNIYKCMQQAAKKINNRHIVWLAGGQPLKSYPIGGHIHFSQVPLNLRLIRSLDNYLTLPLFLLESEESISRRPKYGFIGDYREQYHGGFEYRTPPSWIISPRIAIGVLSLAKVIASDFNQLTWMPLNNIDIQEAFLMGNKRSIYPIVSNLWEELKKCNSYTTYRQYLDSFFKLIENHEEWDEYADIRLEWRLST